MLLVAILLAVGHSQIQLPSFIKKAAAAVSSVIGGGSINSLAAFSSTNQIGNSIIYDNGTNVGIGTTNPGYKLDVSGDVRATGFYYSSSDRTLKKDIQKISNALEKIMQLDGVTFKWKDNDEPSVGLIAQDVEKVFPELVTTNPTTNLKSLGYSNLVAPIIEAIKELAKKVEDIVVSIGQIKDEIIFHERQIGDLQTKIDDQQKAIKVLQSEIQAVNRK